MIARGALRWGEQIAWLAGASLIAWSVVAAAHAGLYQWQAHRTLEDPARVVTAGLAPGEALGRLQIARLRLDVVVSEGDAGDVLSVAAGHLPDTPMPWEPGNSAIAAHRDSLFRPLERIRQHDVIQLTTSRGTFTYQVASTAVVRPDDLSVLLPTGRNSLTLITCYPFRYVGAAPKRFVVRADEMSARPAPKMTS